MLSRVMSAMLLLFCPSLMAYGNVPLIYSCSLAFASCGAEIVTVVLLSAVKCSAIDGLADATAAFVPAYFSCDSVVDYSDVFSYLSGGCFWGNNLYPEYFDMNAVMLHRLPDDAYHAWRSALDEAVPYKVASSKWLSGIRECNYAVNDSVYSGLSMFVPRADTNYARLNADFKTTGWYNVTGWSSAGW